MLAKTVDLEDPGGSKKFGFIVSTTLVEYVPAVSIK